MAYPDRLQTLDLINTALSSINLSFWRPVACRQLDLYQRIKEGHAAFKAKPATLGTDCEEEG